MEEFRPLDLFFEHNAPVYSLFRLSFQGLNDDRRTMSQNMGIMVHPEIDILIPVHIPELGPFGPIH